MNIKAFVGVLLAALALHARTIPGLERKILDFYGPTLASPFKAEALISTHIPSYLRILIDGSQGVAEVRALQDNGGKWVESHFCGTKDIQWVAPTFSTLKGLAIKCMKDGESYSFSVPDATREKPVGNRFFLAGIREGKRQGLQEWFWISAEFKIHNRP